MPGVRNRCPVERSKGGEKSEVGKKKERGGEDMSLVTSTIPLVIKMAVNRNTPSRIFCFSRQSCGRDNVQHSKSISPFHLYCNEELTGTDGPPYEEKGSDDLLEFANDVPLPLRLFFHGGPRKKRGQPISSCYGERASDQATYFLDSVASCTRCDIY